MSKIKTLLTMVATLMVATLTAQEISVQAPQSVYEGDNLTVKFVVNAQATDFKGPSFKGFSLRSGPQTMSSASMSIVNGKMTNSVSTTYTYTLAADVAGTYTIEPATCTAGGKKISSKSFSIKVEKMSAAQKQQRQQQQQQQRSRQQFDPWDQQPQSEVQISDKTLFARASVNKKNPYQGEQLIITYKIYTQIPISQYAIDKLPGNRGFWAEDLSEGQKIKQYEETVGDSRYQVAEIRRGALFAQESGTLEIEPLDLDVLAMVQRQRKRTGSIWDLFDDPFFNMQQAVEHSLKTNKVKINVRPLPQAPDGFGGAVGRFDISGGLTQNNIKANEAVSYKITISGSGNLMLIDAPNPEFPSTFEVFDPQIDDNIRKSESGISGSRTYEWVLIPRTKGTYTIPEMNYVYFDPSTGKYVSKKIAAQRIEVEPGAAQSLSTIGGKDDVRLLNNDINYIHPIKRLKKTEEKESMGWGFVVAAVLIVLLTVGVGVAVKRKRIADQDVANLRLRRATRMAKRRLKKAAAYLGSNDSNRFYEEIYRAIWGCLADKYNIELSQLSRETVSACLTEKQVSAEQTARIMQMLQDVDMARFAPGDAGAQKQRIYDEAMEMIANL